MTRDRVLGVWRDGTKVLFAETGQLVFDPPLDHDELPQAGDTVELEWDEEGRPSLRVVARSVTP